MEGSKMQLVVSRFYADAKNVVVVELQHPDQKPLPEFTPGSHLEVYLPNGMIRHYSLLNHADERHRYVIAVGLVSEGRGGSQFIHQSLRVNDLLEVSAPRNHFGLVPADSYCFIVGGIGITPILSMLRWCIAHDKKWRLFYSVRSKQRAAFAEELAALSNGQVHFHYTDEKAGQYLDISQIVQGVQDNEHIYCCGPLGLMQSVKEQTAQIKNRVHFEWFDAPTVQPRADTVLDQFTVKLKQSNKEIQVLSDQSILDALELEGYDIPFSCRAGICRTCETSVCAGTPEHLDMILSDEEKALNNTMLICISRAKTSVLELDL